MLGARGEVTAALVLALLVAACGPGRAATGDGPPGGAAEPPPFTAPAPARSLPAPPASGDTPDLPSEGRRRDPIALAAERGWGVDGDRLVGPGGLDLDLGRCPADEAADGPITVGTNVAAGLVEGHEDGLRDAFDAANEAGGIDGRPIVLVTATEGSGHWVDPAGTLTELVEAHAPTAIVPAGGAPGDVEEAAAILAGSCTPGLFWLGTGPSPSPWVTFGLRDLRSELATVASWLAAGDHREVLVVVPALADAFRLEVETIVDPIVPARYAVIGGDAPAALDLDPDGQPPGAAIIASSGTHCETGPRAVRAAAPAAVVVTLGSACPPWGYGPGVARVDGTVQLHWTAPAAGDGPADPRAGLRADGRRTGELVVETLRLASRLDGGLGRANVLLASLLLDHAPVDALPGVRLRTLGPSDPYPLEGGVPHRWDAAAARWLPHGDGSRVDADGRTPLAPRVEPEPLGADPCRARPALDLFTTHWFPVELGATRVDPRADIVLHVGGDREPVSSARLRATAPSGTEIVLDLVPQREPTCGSDRSFDLPLGDARALHDLGDAFTVVFEIDQGAWSTEPVRWPDDFDRVVPFPPVELAPATVGP